MVMRHGNETVDEARARDAKTPRDKPPKAKRGPGRPPKPPAPTKADLKQLEWELAEALRAPAMAAGLAGDDWAVWHFEKEAPILARNLVTAAEHNPWLREKLEAAAMGGDLMLYKLISALSVTGALVAYAVPPLIYYGLPVPHGAREIFKVPDRRALKREQEAVRAAERIREEAERAAAEATAARGGPNGAAETADPATYT